MAKKMIHDPFEHIGDINSAHHSPSDAFNAHNPPPHEQSTDLNALARRHQSSNVANHSENNSELSKELLDPTLGYVKKVTLTIPVNMMLGGSADELADEAADFSDQTNSSPDMTVPTYSVKQSRFSLYAAFPPPPIMLPTNRHADGNNRRSSRELNNAKQRLKRYSGFHGAIGMTSATHGEQGYVATTLSMNYRFPKYLSIPTRPQNLPIVGNMHCNIHMGTNTKQSVGGTVSSLDGRSSFCIDVGNPFPKPYANLHKKSGILPPRLDRRSYNFSFARDCNWLNIPLRIQGFITLAPLPRPNWVIYGKKYESQAMNLSLIHI